MKRTGPDLKKSFPSPNHDVGRKHDDEALVLACQKGLPYDSRAFEILLERYEHTVFQACMAYLGNEADAEEAGQDIFLRVFHGLPKMKNQARFRTWLYRITQNVCANYYRRKKERERRLVHGTTIEILRSTTQQIPKRRKSLLRALDQLTEKDRRILVLRHILELPFEEISNFLKIGLSAAKMRVYRAEEKLRAFFPDRPPGKL